MAYDVFISYSTQDKLTADGVCAILESHGIRCWIAPRDIPLGADWTESIVNAIEVCPIMVLVFSRHANESHQIKREVNLAVDNARTVIPVRVEDVMPSKSLKFSININHWLDAFPPPLENHFQHLAESIRGHLGLLTSASAKTEEVERALDLPPTPAKEEPAAPVIAPREPEPIPVAASSPPPMENRPPPIEHRPPPMEIRLLPKEPPPMSKAPPTPMESRTLSKAPPAIAKTIAPPRDHGSLGGQVRRLVLTVIWTIIFAFLGTLISAFVADAVGRGTFGGLVVILFFLGSIALGVVLSVKGKLPGTGK
jgi:hypothetical protein